MLYYCYLIRLVSVINKSEDFELVSFVFFNLNLISLK